MSADPIDLLFGGMEKLGPGSDADTLAVLRRLPQRELDVIVDAGCGAGRQTLVLAKELRRPVHAIDSYEPFLNALERRAAETGVGQFVRVRRMDMKDIPDAFPDIDLLWSEGAAYNIGFDTALALWARAMRPRGLAAVSELAWLSDDASQEASAFFRDAYPGMRHTRDNIAAAEGAGYTILGTHTLPRQAWVDGYYDVLAPRAKELASHPEAAVRDFARETLREIEVFESSGESYGYVFYLLQLG